ncbi:MAG: ferritin-like domain-containing protein [Candidatus Eiseniibacteriota bacterium]|nr:MAG: ferritin-like domain-containing protein [Candidatus Eisenbacteria bacterium]
MKVYRCRICGQSFVGRRKPANCPFCGAPEKYAVLARNWKEDMISTLTDISEKNLKIALRLEIDNSGFYRCAARVAVDEELKAMFSAMGRIEAEHASTVRRMLGLPRSSRYDHQGRCYPTDDQNLQEALRREELTASLYEQAAKQASEKRVREVLLALTEIEKEHLAMNSRKA